MKRRLEQVPLPDERVAQDRVWKVVQAAFADREPVVWPRRHVRALAVAAAVAVLAAATVTPPGRSVVNSVRDVVGRERVAGVRPAHRELVRLPTRGRLLVQSSRGPWVVAENGSRRLLGPYAMASWSPHGKYLIAVRGTELLALTPHGDVRWVEPRKQRISFPRWSFEGYRIAYLSGASLRVITGDGKQDWGIGSADPAVPPAWRYATHQVAYVGAAGDVRVAEADGRRVLWKRRAGPDGVRALTWSDDGERLLALGRSSVRVYGAGGRLIGAVPTLGPSTSAAFAPGSHRLALVVGQMALLVDGDALRFPDRALFTGARGLSGVAWSPDGRWLLLAWPAADQFVFLRLTPPKVVAVSNMRRQFDPGSAMPRFPAIGGWCCGS